MRWQDTIQRLIKQSGANIYYKKPKYTDKLKIAVDFMHEKGLLSDFSKYISDYKKNKE